MEQSNMISNNTNSSIFFSMIHSRKSVITWLVTQMLVGFLTAIFNLITVLTFLLNGNLRRRRSVYCLINLAVADMMFGLFSVPDWFSTFSMELFQVQTQRHLKIFLEISIILLSLASIISLVDISVERWFAMFFPFRHRTLQTKVYAIAFAKTWLLTTVVSLLYNLTYDHHWYGRALFWTTIFLSIVIISSCYLAIFLKVRNKTNFQQHQGPATLHEIQKRERDLATTLFIVTLLSFITWMPLIIFRVVNRQYKFYDVIYRFPNVTFFLKLLQSLNSFINPVVYVLRMKDFRNALFQFIFVCSYCRRYIYPFNENNNNRGPGNAIELAAVPQRVTI